MRCLPALLLFVASSLYADAVYVRKGGSVKKYEGKIVRETDRTVTIRTVIGTIKCEQTFNRPDIVKIERGEQKKRELDKKIAALDWSDPAQVREVIDWCREQGHLTKAKELEDQLEKRLHEIWKQQNADRLCPVCKGDKVVPCQLCGGKRRVQKPCEKCNGAGKVVFECSTCVQRRSTTSDTLGTSDWRRGYRDPRYPDGRSTQGPHSSSTYVSRTYTGVIRCPHCGGKGSSTRHERTHTGKGIVEKEITEDCKYCKGTGEAICPECRGKGGQLMTCRHCRGSGKVYRKCTACDGRGDRPCRYCSGLGIVDPGRRTPPPRVESTPPGRTFRGPATTGPSGVSPLSRGPATVYSDDGILSLELPHGWHKEADPNSILTAVSPMEYPGDTFREKVAVTQETTEFDNVEDYYQYRVKRLADMAKVHGALLGKVKKVEDVAFRDATLKRVLNSYEQLGIYTVEYIFLVNGRACTIRFTAKATTYWKWARPFEQIVESVRFHEPQ